MKRGRGRPAWPDQDRNKNQARVRFRDDVYDALCREAIKRHIHITDVIRERVERDLVASGILQVPQKENPFHGT